MFIFNGQNPNRPWENPKIKMPRIDILGLPKVALRWTPQGKRKQGRHKATLRRTVEREIKVIGLTCGDAVITALDKIGWRQRREARIKEQEEEVRYPGISGPLF